MSTDSQYHSSSAVIIIVLNALSFLSLSFVLMIYIVRWKKITSFPLRLVMDKCYRWSCFICVLHAWFRTCMCSCIILWVLMMFRPGSYKCRRLFVCLRLYSRWRRIFRPLCGSRWLFTPVLLPSCSRRTSNRQKSLISYLAFCFVSFWPSCNYLFIGKTSFL